MAAEPLRTCRRGVLAQGTPRGVWLTLEQAARIAGLHADAARHRLDRLDAQLRAAGFPTLWRMRADGIAVVRATSASLALGRPHQEFLKRRDALLRHAVRRAPVANPHRAEGDLEHAHMQRAA